MKKTNIYLFTLLSLGLASCSVESPFQGEHRGEGFLSKAAIDMNLNVDETIKVTRAGLSDVNTDDFQVEIINLSGGSNKKFDYKDMPEIVTLTEGTYKIEVTYNDDLEAAWNNPHFKGESKNFIVKADEITTDIEPIICSLQNVMVSVVLDDDLLNNHITGDPEIEVWVNNGSPLTFTNQHYGSSNPVPGYFRHSEVCTLTAQFKGVVDGVTVTETKTLSDVQAGNHYRITFYRHSYQGEDQGGVEPQIKVEAKVDVNNIATNVDMEEDKVLEDATFPTESPAEGDVPGTTEPTEPDNPQPEEKDLSVSDDDSDAKLGVPYIVNEDSKIALTFKSKAGFEEFIVQVESTGGLTELIGEGSESGTGNGKLDLVNPGTQKEFMKKVGLLKGDSVGGENKVIFDVSELMGLLLMVEGTHTFNIHVKDSSGELNEKLILIVEPKD